MRKLSAAIALSVLAGAAAPQGFPTKPVTLIVPFPPGGSTDTAARIIGERMRPALEILTGEFLRTMQLCGIRSVAQIGLEPLAEGPML